MIIKIKAPRAARKESIIDEQSKYLMPEELRGAHIILFLKISLNLISFSPFYCSDYYFLLMRGLYIFAINPEVEQAFLKYKINKFEFERLALVA